MKILVFSDSHGYLEFMLQVISHEDPDYVIHLGDHSADAEQIRLRFPLLAVAGVKGNCDYSDFTTRDRALLRYDDIKVFAVHGHAYGVKSSLLRLFMAAKENAVHVALFGHTHCAFCELKDGIWLMNPGSCGKNAGQTYGLIEISDRKLSCCIKTLKGRTEHHDTCN